MNIEFIMAYIPRKMKEIGVDSYVISHRHFILTPHETREIDASNEYYFLVTADEEISIESDLGRYDNNDEGILEQQHEHQGKLRVKNNSISRKQIQFIQVKY